MYTKILIGIFIGIIISILGFNLYNNSSYEQTSYEVDCVKVFSGIYDIDFAGKLPEGINDSLGELRGFEIKTIFYNNGLKKCFLLIDAINTYFDIVGKIIFDERYRGISIQFMKPEHIEYIDREVAKNLYGYFDVKEKSCKEKASKLSKDIIDHFYQHRIFADAPGIIQFTEYEYNPYFDKCFGIIEIGAGGTNEAITDKYMYDFDSHSFHTRDLMNE